MSLNDLDSMLSRETEQNKTQGWNKLDKTIKIQKLNSFADKYGATNEYSEIEVQSLKQFLRECLDKSKLKNTKDVYYNKDTKEVTHIPSLMLNSTTHNFTLKNVETTATKKTVRNVQPRNVSVKDRKVPIMATAKCDNPKENILADIGDKVVDKLEDIVADMVAKEVVEVVEVIEEVVVDILL
jgi:hypothetical protein